MKNNLTCELVEDLMPSYIDALTSDVTNKAIREHLAQCDKCKNKLDNMKEGQTDGSAPLCISPLLEDQLMCCNEDSHEA